MKSLGFGFMRLPLIDANDPSSIDMPQVEKMVDIFISRGFCHFDTAYSYHKEYSEPAFREAVVKRYLRDRFTITDKMPCWFVKKTDDFERIFNTQLKRCGVDYFDYYWLHCLNHDNVRIIDENGGWAFMRRKKEEGKIRHIGFSFHDDSALLEKILDAHPEMELVQLQINYLDWDSPTVESGNCYDICVKYGKKVVVMEPVKGGSLAAVPEAVKRLFNRHAPGASAASWAIRYCASLPNVVLVLSGMSDIAQVEDNTSFMRNFVPLTDEEQAIVTQAANIIKKSIPIPCTACHYCTDGCPARICIPEYFDLYNNLHQFGEKYQGRNTEVYYDILTQTHGRAGDCMECRQCEKKCPQHIKIIDNLKLVAKTFE